MPIVPIRFCPILWMLLLPLTVSALSTTGITDSIPNPAGRPLDPYYHKYNQGVRYYQQGRYNEALGLFTNCKNHFEEVDTKPYLRSLYYQGLCHNALGHPSFSTAGINLGFAVARDHCNLGMLPYFTYAEGVSLVGLHHYDEALSKLTAALPDLIKNRDAGNELAGYYYLGKAYWQLNQKQQAAGFFQKATGGLEHYGYSHPNVREAYEYLIDYYRMQGKSTPEQQAIEHLLQEDAYLAKRYPYLFPRTVKRYTIPLLMERKAALEKGRLLRTIGIYIMALLVVALVYFSYRYLQSRALFSRVRQAVASKLRKLIFGRGPIGLREDLELEILQKLVEFERHKRYLQKDISQPRLATLLQTNTKYVSQVVYKHRGKNTTDYIADVKIAHIVELLQHHKKYRNYTNQALADEAGFGSVSSFVRAFKQHTGLSTSEFMAGVG